MGSSAAKIRRQIFQELGIPGEINDDGKCIPSPGVKVELSDKAFDTCVELGTQWFTARKGFVVWRPMPVLFGVVEYKMSQDVQNVLDVQFEIPSDVAAFFSLGFFDLIPYGPQNIGSLSSGLSSYSGFVQLLQFNEQRKRVFSVEPEWFYDQQNQILRVPLRLGTTNNLMMIQAKLNTFRPEQLVDKDDYIFSRYVKAKCKEIVGRIRSKYDSLPGASGPISLDGKDLIAEAKEEIEKLEIEIFASQGPDLGMNG